MKQSPQSIIARSSLSADARDVGAPNAEGLLSYVTDLSDKRLVL
jgi:hypothetical protein